MRRSLTSLFALALAVCAASVPARAQAGGRQPLTVSDLLKIQRVGDPQLSPDGRWIAYQISVPDVEANRSRTQLYLVSVDGGQPKQLTSGASSASTPRWSPDGRTIYYVMSGQLHALDVASGRSR